MMKLTLSISKVIAVLMGAVWTAICTSLMLSKFITPLPTAEQQVVQLPAGLQ
jgi:hypothetical protein